MSVIYTAVASTPMLDGENGSDDQPYRQGRDTIVLKQCYNGVYFGHKSLFIPHPPFYSGLNLP